MSGIVLSASVRQNLLSLQSTADLLSTTQNRLATGNKVNSALDNPTNFFTAQGLDNRAGDINNLLDSIGNGVQVLQAANTGITSLQKLVDTAKSIANQALQTPSGYSTKSQASATITGATASNLLGGTTTAATNAKVTSTVDLSSAQVDASGGAITFSVNSQSVTLSTTGGTASDGKYSLSDLEAAINTQVGTSAKVNATDDGSGHLVLTSTNTAGASDAITLGGTTTGVFGATPTVTAGTDASTTGGLSGLQLTIGSTAGGQALDITFGAGTQTYDSSTGVATNVSTLDQLNTVLTNNNLSASIDSTGKLTITTTNDYASTTIGALAGSATGTGPFTAGAGSAPVADANVQNTRGTLISQYNAVIDQIRTTAQDSSFNGVNLINGDQLKLVFNETGKSTLTIQGVTFDPAGLGLSSLTSGTDFLDNATTNKVLDSLNNASGTLRSQASTFGSNLSIVQIRQDFNKNLINVLQTGSSNLTLADTNEEAANSQALSTRQSIAVSALALANQSNQSVLQLLR
ncbi:flagellin [Nitrobacter sp. NHB1]|uniref:flagellin N-terminal helical domain-containing protein n=1 Tax=Nitrobacter sp. NHB1 TaxID=3119830 RepID=UPI00300039A9